jgi:hypothetical protein
MYVSISSIVITKRDSLNNKIAVNHQIVAIIMKNFTLLRGQINKASDYKHTKLTLKK